MRLYGVWVPVCAALVGIACSDGKTGSEPEESPSATGGDGSELVDSGAGGDGSGGTSTEDTEPGGSGGNPLDAIEATDGVSEVSCESGVMYARKPEADLDTPERITGSNGTFTDACAGDVLIGYFCGTDFSCDPDCQNVGTGIVEESQTRCGTGCVNGACLTD